MDPRNRVHGSPLSRREWEILQLTALGYRAPVVSRTLGIGPWTVERHLRSARHKLGARTTVHAVTIAAARGWLADHLPHEPAPVITWPAGTESRSQAS